MKLKKILSWLENVNRIGELLLLFKATISLSLKYCNIGQYTHTHTQPGEKNKKHANSIIEKNYLGIACFYLENTSVGKCTIVAVQF